MKTILQCPTCKAIKFVKGEDKTEYWQSLTPVEILAFEIMYSSENLQIVVGGILVAYVQCDYCKHSIEN